jgi:hypothetical protein
MRLGSTAGRGYGRKMDPTQITPAVHTPFADLDLLLGEAERDALVAPERTGEDEREPDTVDAFNAQILAGLVSP